ncbi:MAG TPA: transglutaminase-like domain-containing protein [Spirochaetota bacterium]|nr:transglutaminase-like domain-containing protein [Spirochaetota bacterium]HPI90300.1 transglutaminase-like domain-containing protein [Spirochaetota bacterium]HPR49310.1 transglutaminase-like domain-containing protein [Spirochaetota bacterium]
MTDTDKYLAATKYFDGKHETVLSRTREITSPLNNDAEKAAALFTFVRDTVRYNPYMNLLDEKIYIASNVIASRATFCVPKAVLLVTMARAAGIPARIRFADIRNHLLPEKMKEALSGDVIYGHGFAELLINGTWLKATPAFDRFMCEERGYRLTEFNGAEDAVFHELDLKGNRHIDYLSYTDPFDDLPYTWLTDYYLEKFDKFREYEPLLRKGIMPEA